MRFINKKASSLGNILEKLYAKNLDAFPLLLVPSNVKRPAINILRVQQMRFLENIN